MASVSNPQTVPEHQKQHAVIADRITRTILAGGKKFLERRQPASSPFKPLLLRKVPLKSFGQLSIPSACDLSR